MDIMKDPRAAAAFKPFMDGAMSALQPSGEESEAAREAISSDMAMAMMQYMPLRSLASFAPDKSVVAQVEKILDALNAE